MTAKDRGFFIKFKQKRTAQETENLVIEITTGVYDKFDKMFRDNIHEGSEAMRAVMRAVIEKEGGDISLHGLVHAAIMAHFYSMKIMCESGMLKEMCAEYEKIDDQEHGRG